MVGNSRIRCCEAATPVERVFRLQQAPGELRTAIFEQREHLVVPVVALVEGVIHPVNADFPELVLAEELEQVPQGWNGEPATWDHPNINGERVSANTPEVLELFRVGRVFNARVEQKRLKLDAWIDVDLANASEQGRRLVERINAGDIIEVSVGAFVIAEDKAGMFNGKPYAAIWREIVPDHLALLPEGTIGACSVESGCGAPRAAAAGGHLHRLSADGVLCGPDSEPRGPEPMGKTRKILKTLLDYVRPGDSMPWALALFRASQDDDRSDNEVRAVLHDALFNEVPAFLGIEEVKPASSLVIYAVAADDDVRWFERSFEIAEDDEVTFGEATEVKPETRFVPVTAASAADRGRNKGDIPMDKAKQIAALINSESTPYTDDDKPALEAMSDDTVEALHDSLEDDGGEQAKGEGEKPKQKPAEEPKGEKTEEPEEGEKVEQPEGEKVEQPVAAAGKPEPMSEEDWMAQAPPRVRKIFAEAERIENERKDELIKTLSKAGVADEEKLADKSLEDLEELADVASKASGGAINYAGKGTPRAASAKGDEDDQAVEPPPSLATAVANRQEQLKK